MRFAAVVILLLAGFAALGYAGVFDGLFRKSPADIAKAAGVVETADVVKIPVTVLDSGKALFLSLEAEGRQLYYFALKSSDGRYRAALDACDVCFRTNRGYRQEGDRMVCNQCGQIFASVRIGEIKGGCNPHPLAHKEEAGYMPIDGADYKLIKKSDYMLIKKADIVAGKEYFARKRS